MMDPHLTITAPNGPVRAVALVLHGGRANSHAPVRPTHLTVIRMTPFATSLRRAGADLGLAVARPRYLVPGSNGGARAPCAAVPRAETAGAAGANVIAKILAGAASLVV